jgi:hypothetical protein
MSDQDNIFNKEGDSGSQNPETQPAQNDTNTQLDQLLQGIKNEQGESKYGSVEEGLKALQASQEYIAKLEGENSEFKAKSVEGATLQAVLDKLKPSEGETALEQGSQLTEADIANLVSAKVDNINLQSTQDANVSAVTSKFIELYGEKAESELYAQAEAKGLDRTWINSLAAKNPDAVFKVLGVDAKKSSTGVGTSHNTAQFNQAPAEPKLFNPFVPEVNSDIEKWRKSANATLERIQQS